MYLLFWYSTRHGLVVPWTPRCARITVVSVAIVLCLGVQLSFPLTRPYRSKRRSSRSLYRVYQGVVTQGSRRPATSSFRLDLLFKRLNLIPQGVYYQFVTRVLVSNCTFFRSGTPTLSPLCSSLFLQRGGMALLVFTLMSCRCVFYKCLCTLVFLFLCSSLMLLTHSSKPPLHRRYVFFILPTLFL